MCMEVTHYCRKPGVFQSLENSGSSKGKQFNEGEGQGELLLPVVIMTTWRTKERVQWQLKAKV